MTLSASECAVSASMLAKSILDTWRSGDNYRLRLELESIARMPESSENDDESDRMELLKSMAKRMQDSPNLFTSPCENPCIETWLDLLHHLSAENPSVN